MQRVRQFRVWDLRNQCFLPITTGVSISMIGTLIINGELAPQTHFERFYEITEQLDREIKDVNGINIFESDLVAYDSATTIYNFTREWDQCLLEVFYQREKARFWLRNYLTGELDEGPIPWREVRIVSNIYDLGIIRKGIRS